MPDQHARLSPSSAKRWISCPASVRVSEAMKPDEQPPESPWAVEGTRAHTLAELEADYRLRGLRKGPYLQRYTRWRKTVSAEEAREMEKHVRGYVKYLKTALSEMPGAQLMLEQRVHPDIPSSWGTSDAILLSATKIRIVDFKYGQGVKVSAVENPQTMIYGLGALLEFGDVLGEVDTVEMSIYQPRLDWASTWELSADELRAWRLRVLPVAEEALGPDAHFDPSPEACRWCPAAGVCRPRMEKMVAEDFTSPPDTLDEADLADVLAKLPDIRSWCQAVEEAALDRAYSQGHELPGWKVVLSGGRRTVPDAPAAIQRLIDQGYNAEQVARFQLKTLGDLEKLVGGKEKLQEMLGDQMVRTPGRPSMVVENDPRPAISPASRAADDFNESE